LIIKMNIIRKIKLESLGYYKFIDIEKELVCFINDNFLNLVKVTFLEYTDYIFYFKENKLIFEYDLDENWIQLNESIWSVFITKFDYKYEEIRDLIKDIVKYYYNLYVKQVYNLSNLKIELIEYLQNNLNKF